MYNDSECKHNEESGSDIDQEWNDFMEESSNQSNIETTILEENDAETNVYKKTKNVPIPNASPLVISTKSKEIFLNKAVDLNIFWKIPLISYDEQKAGCLKKQMRVKYKTPEEYADYLLKKEQGLLIDGCNYLHESIFEHMDVQKVKLRHFNYLGMVSFGLCSKDLYDVIKKVFMNCFILIIRLELPVEIFNINEELYNSSTTSISHLPSGPKIFHEYNVKVFNTGKITFTGVKNSIIFKELLNVVINILKLCAPHEWMNYSSNIEHYKQVNILVNSNFKCGFCLNQSKLRRILTTKYNLICVFNYGNQYTGLRTKFYYDTSKSPEEQTGQYNSTTDTLDLHENKNKMSKLVSYPPNIVRISYSIFRTGSVLISGKCDDDILNHVYLHVANLLKDEFPFIYAGCAEIKTKKTQKQKKFLKNFLVPLD